MKKTSPKGGDVVGRDRGQKKPARHQSLCRGQTRHRAYDRGRVRSLRFFSGNADERIFGTKKDLP